MRSVLREINSNEFVTVSSVFVVGVNFFIAYLLHKSCREKKLTANRQQKTVSSNFLLSSKKPTVFFYRIQIFWMRHHYANDAHDWNGFLLPIFPSSCHMYLSIVWLELRSKSRTGCANRSFPLTNVIPSIHAVLLYGINIQYEALMEPPAFNGANVHIFSIDIQLLDNGDVKISYTKGFHIFLVKEEQFQIVFSIKKWFSVNWLSVEFNILVPALVRS